MAPFKDLLSNLAAEHEALLRERDTLAVENERLHAALASTQSQPAQGPADAEPLAAGSQILLEEHPQVSQPAAEVEVGGLLEEVHLTVLEEGPRPPRDLLAWPRSLRRCEREVLHAAPQIPQVLFQRSEPEDAMGTIPTAPTSRSLNAYKNFTQVNFVLRLYWKLNLQLNSADSGVLEHSSELQQALQSELKHAMLTSTQVFEEQESYRRRRLPSSTSQLMADSVQSVCGRLSSGSCLHPQSNARITSDICGILFVFWDLVMSPLQLLWEEAESHAVRAFDLFVNIFWTMDMLLLFRTGFYHDGKLVMDPRKICINYARTWLAFDCCVVLPEWVLFASQSALPDFANPSLLRLFRIMRFMRLMRMVKLRRIKHEIFCRITSEHWMYAVRIFVWILTLMGILHVFACIWYGLGNGSAYGWVNTFSAQQESLPSRYMISLQWAFSNLLGNSHVHPVTPAERLFSVIVSPVCVGLLVVLISATTNMLQGQRYFRREYHERAVRSFLARHEVEPKTAVRMQKIVEDESNRLDRREQDEELLKLLPRELLREVMVQVRGRALVSRSRIFTYCDERFVQFFGRLCDEALQTVHCREGDKLFLPGDVCTMARCVSKGRLEYSFCPAEAVQTHVVTKGQWVCEVVLWTGWKHVGTLVSDRETMIFNVPVDQFTHVASDYVEVRYSLALYAKQFLSHLNTQVGPNDLMANLPVWTWDAEHFDCNVVMNDSSQVPLPWASDLPSHLRERVCKAAVVVAQRIAANGLDENRPHHGFTIIVGDPVELESCGKAGFNPFQGHNLCILDARSVLDEEVFDTLRRNAFNCDGAIVVDAKSSRVVASGWFVADISLGGTSGGARSRSSKAIAQQAGGCYVVKASEDSRGEVILHLNAERLVFDSTLEPDLPAVCDSIHPNQADTPSTLSHEADIRDADVRDADGGGLSAPAEVEFGQEVPILVNHVHV